MFSTVVTLFSGYKSLAELLTYLSSVPDAKFKDELNKNSSDLKKFITDINQFRIAANHFHDKRYNIFIELMSTHVKTLTQKDKDKLKEEKSLTALLEIPHEKTIALLRVKADIFTTSLHLLLIRDFSTENFTLALDALGNHLTTLFKNLSDLAIVYAVLSGPKRKELCELLNKKFPQMLAKLADSERVYRVMSCLSDVESIKLGQRQLTFSTQALFDFLKPYVKREELMSYVKAQTKQHPFWQNALTLTAQPDKPAQKTTLA